MIVPRSRLLWVTGLVILPLSVVAGLVSFATVAASALIAVVLIAAAVDAVLAPRAVRGLMVTLPELVRLARRREGSIEIRLTHDGSTAKRLRIGLAFPQEIESAEDDRWITLPSGSPVCQVICACVASKRGSYILDKVYLEGVSPLGFWGARTIASVQCELRVYPDLAKDSKRMAAKFLNRGGVGVHRQRQIGRGREFEKLREYSAGDDYSEIHWKATARHGRPVTKVFQVERTQEVYVVIDSSRLTARPAGDSGDTILERYVNAALLFGLAAEREGDLFGLVTFSDRVHGFVRAKNGKAHYSACQDTLYALQPRAVTPDFEELCSFLRLRLRRRALVVFLTTLDDPALAESFERAIMLLRRQHLILIGVVAPAEAKPLFIGSEPESVDEIYDRLGGHIIWHGLQELGGELKQLGARFSLLDPDNLTTQLTTLYLDVKQRQLL